MRFFEALKFTTNHFGLLAALNLVVVPRLVHRFIKKERFSYNFRLRKYLRNEIPDIINKFKEEPLLRSNSSPSNSVYSLWWDSNCGLSSVVNLCQSSLKYNLNGHRLIQISKDNYHNYITLPDYILEKVEKRKISISHLSDIIRLCLLRKYGGTWIDSCLFVVKPLVFYKSLNMPRFPKNDSANQGKWSFGIISVPSDHKLMCFMQEVLLRYWRNHDTAIDYLMFDSFMMIAYEEFPDIRTEIDKFQVSSPDLHRTRYLFDKPIDESVFKSIIENNQFLSLTWRINYPYSLNGKQTYYGALNSWMKERRIANESTQNI